MFCLKLKDILDPEAASRQPHAHHDQQWPFSARKTDPEGWRLTAEKTGRLRWKYLRTEQERNELPQDVTTRYYMGRDTVCLFQMRLDEVELN